MTQKSKAKSAKLPFVFSNFAMTADGKIAFAGGEFVPFGSRRDLEHLYELRATADAVMCGARTIETGSAICGSNAGWRSFLCGSSSAAAVRSIRRQKFSRNDFLQSSF
jgi:hypothetical protein